MCWFIIHKTLQWLFTVLLFCACCFICRSYSYMDCLFSFYAMPYVFTFYVTFIPVTVCECHTEIKATWLDLTFNASPVTAPSTCLYNSSSQSGSWNSRYCISKIFQNYSQTTSLDSAWRGYAAFLTTFPVHSLLIQRQIILIKHWLSR